MSIKKVWIEDGCIACGACESICPEVFTVTDDCVINDVNVAEYTDEIKEAAADCPVDVIKFEE